MAVLHNRISQEELKQALLKETAPRTTISFYRYFSIKQPGVFRDELYKGLVALKVFGRIYVAEEGVNAQISVPQHNLPALKEYLDSVEGLQDLRLNIAPDDDGKSFWVLKIKVREKIVADGINDASFDVNKKGRYLDAAEMNRFCEDPETIILDMRNHYEYEVGHFNGAVEIPSDTFREQLPMAVEMMQEHKDKNIVMYCTGGIRCEKASAYMLHNGFKNVRHLEGGIINYAKQVKELGLPSRFTGKNFVFDNRLGERITTDIIAQCHQCGKPCDAHTNCKNDGCHLLFIQCEECAALYNGCCSKECNDIYLLPADEQKELRKGMDKGQHIFNKAKARLRPRKEDIRKKLQDG
ncbi:MAG: rhodanese-related sulfurtransferase [Chitinophagaceae bacterium]|nr:rhodanese-related sulfurtransferase [Chitinophagaceae bacterium]MCW5925286.1 rhodanese-related sulfurtransferase [Chitinophagaceae bacterium]